MDDTRFKTQMAIYMQREIGRNESVTFTFD